MAQQYGPEWMLWLWIGIALASVIGAIAAARHRTPRLLVLPGEHIAAAALLGVIAWEAAVQAPSIVLTITSAYAGIAGAPGQGVYEAYAVVFVGSVIGAVVAIVGLLRRYLWAIVLGIGVALVRIGTTIIGVVTTLAVVGESGGFEFAGWWALQIGLGAVPAAVAVALLVLPVVRGRVRPMAATPSPGADVAASA